MISDPRAPAVLLSDQPVASEIVRLEKPLAIPSFDSAARELFCGSFRKGGMCRKSPTGAHDGLYPQNTGLHPGTPGAK